MTFAVDATQLDQAAASLRQLADQLSDVDPIEHEAAVTIESTGRPLAPRRTGALAASITVRAGSIVSQLPYAAPVHWGWRRGGASAPPRPWLLQARDRAMTDVIERTADHVTQLIGRVE